MSVSRWTAWALRAPMIVALIAHLRGGYGAGARMALVGLALSVLPRAVRTGSQRGLPPIAELPYLLAVSLQTVSKAFNLPRRIGVWDKLVHFTELLLLSWLFTVFLRGYRDTFNPAMPTRLVQSLAAFAGVTVGSLWEVVEYVLDRLVRQNLVKSVRGTALDLLADTLGAVVGTLAASRAYDRAADERQRTELGQAVKPDKG